jgi:hypothetical protein
MSVELSRHVARLKMFEPIRHLPPSERRAFLIAIHAAAAFDDLPTAFQDLITEAETARENYIAERSIGVGYPSRGV